MDVVLTPTPRTIVSSIRLIVRSCPRKVEVTIVTAVVATNTTIHFTDSAIRRVTSLKLIVKLSDFVRFFLMQNFLYRKGFRNVLKQFLTLIYLSKKDSNLFYLKEPR